MSYALSVYLVPRDVIMRLPGGGGEELLRDLLPEAREELADLDEQLFDEDDEDDIRHEQAFRELLCGEITAPHYGSRYGWAFQEVCRCLGTRLSNRGFSPCPYEWYGQLDEHLESTGTELKFESLVSECPIAMPLSDDWPVIGHWTGEQMAAGAGPLRQAASAADDPDVAEALQTACEWIEAALQDGNAMLVALHG